MNFPEPSLTTKKRITLAAGHFFAILGIIGAFLPVIPTVPFLIVAAYFYNRDHPHFHQRLMKLPGIGRNLRDWEERRVIRPHAKLLASIFIVVFFAWPLYFGRNQPYVMILLVIVGVSVISFIVTRRSK